MGSRAPAAVDHRSAAAGWLFAGTARFDSRVWQIDYEHARVAGERLSALELDGLFLGGLSSKLVRCAPWNPRDPRAWHASGMAAVAAAERGWVACTPHARSAHATDATPRARHACCTHAADSASGASRLA